MINRRWFSWSALLLLGLTTPADAVVDGNPFTGPEVEVCGPEVPMHPVGLGGRAGPPVPVIEGDTLTVGIVFGCGCAPHFFGGCWSGEFSSSVPVETDLEVAHDANGETCELSCHDQIRIDLTPIADAYHDIYGPWPGTVLIHLRSYSLDYVLSAVLTAETTTWGRIKSTYE